MVCTNGSSTFLSDVLYVPGLGVNLLSARKVCQAGLKGSFSDQHMYFKQGKKKVIEATMSGGLYIITHVADGYHETAFAGTVDEEESDVEMIERRPQEEELMKDEKERYLLMHRRFNHLGPKKIRNLHKVTTLNKAVKIPTTMEICEVCATTKMTNQIRKELNPHKLTRLALVQFDIAGPFPKSLRGNRWFLLIIDSYTRRNWIICFAKKSDAIAALNNWKKEVEMETGNKVQASRSDNAPELIHAVEEWKSGTRLELTTIASSHQNGPAERNIRTAENDMRAILKEAQLPLEFWDEAVEYDAYVRDRTDTGPVIDGNTVSPIEAYTGETPSVDHLRIWGSKCYSHIIPKTIPAGQRRDKLVDTGRVGVFMGFSDHTAKHYKVYSPELGYTHRSSRVIVDETTKGGTLKLKIRGQNSQGIQNVQPDRNPRGRPKKNTPFRPETELNVPTISISEEPVAKTVPRVELPKLIPPENVLRFDEDDDGDIIKDGSPSAKPSPAIKEPTEEKSPTSVETGRADEAPITGTSLIPNNKPNSTGEQILADNAQPRYLFRKRKRDDDDEEDSHRSKLVRAMLALILSDELHDEFNSLQDEHAMLAAPMIPKVDHYVMNRIISNFTALFTSEDEHLDDIALPAEVIQGIHIPRTYKEAINDSKYAAEWMAAIKEEIVSLVANGTWEEFILPKGANLVSTKWVFTIKTKDGKIERFKARLVARGFSQVLGKDYHETFAPTVRMDTLRLFLAMVAKRDLECCHFDIKNAFTESELKEQIFLAPPQGIKVKEGHVLRALRSLYGLKQAGRDWSILLKGELLKMGFTQSLADPCLYVHLNKKLWLLVYVDDIVVAAEMMKEIGWFSNKLSGRFNTKDLGEISKILGMRVVRDRKNRTITLDQEEYLDAMLNKFGYTQAQSQGRKTPIVDYNHIRPATNNDKLINIEEYQQIIGSVMHAMVYTRPDITWIVGRLAQFMTKPAEHHGHALKSLIRYLRTTVKQKLRFGPGGANDKTVDVYTDADWASDKVDRKSFSGGVVMFYNGPISWASKKQNSVSTSSAEAEYIAMAMFAKQGRWIAQVFKDLGMPKYIAKNGDTIQMFGDNQGALALAKNPHLHERSKHIDICYHFIRDLTEKEKVTVAYVKTVDMIADGLTKPLQRVAFERFKEMLGVMDEGTAKKRMRPMGEC